MENKILFSVIHTANKQRRLCIKYGEENKKTEIKKKMKLYLITLL
jgi:hypothetical protein